MVMFKQDVLDLEKKRVAIGQMGDIEMMSHLGIEFPENLSALKLRIRNLNGHVRVAVHPLFLHQKKGHEIPSDEPMLNHFYRSVVSAGNNPSSAPLFVFEGESEYDKTKKIISTIAKSGMSVFILPTYDEDGWPIFKGTKYKSEDYEKMISLFRSLGVKSLTFSGMFLYPYGNGQIGGCVGAIAERFVDSGFSVDFSNKVSYSSFPMSDSQRVAARRKLIEGGFGKQTGKE